MTFLSSYFIAGGKGSVCVCECVFVCFFSFDFAGVRLCISCSHGCTNLEMKCFSVGLDLLIDTV